MSSVLLVEKPRLVIRPWVWDKMMYFSRNDDECEVSGLGLIEFDGTDFTVSKMFLVPQVNTKSDTEMDADGIGKAMFKVKDEPGQLKWHWHSHVNMSTFWSPDDREMIKKNSTHGWFVHTVTNLRGEKKTCVAQQRPFPYFIDDIETVVENPKYSNDIYESWNAEYHDNVRIKKPYSHDWSGTGRSTAMTEGADQKEVEEARAQGHTVCLPPAQTYADDLDRHKKAENPVGDSGDAKEPESNDAAEEMSNDGVLRHLNERLEKLKIKEEELQRLHMLNENDLQIFHMWETVCEDVEEAEDLIERMTEYMVAAGAAVVASEESGVTA